MGWGSTIRRAASPVVSTAAPVAAPVMAAGGATGPSGVPMTTMGAGGSFGPLGGMLSQFVGGGNINSTSGGPTPTTVPVEGGTPGPGQEGFDIQSFIENNPAYQFRLDQGTKALQRSAAAKGMFGSGNLLMDITKYGQGLASQEYGSEMDRIMKMAGVGEGSPAAAGDIYGRHGARGVGYEQEGYGALGGLFSLFQ